MAGEKAEKNTCNEQTINKEDHAHARVRNNLFISQALFQVKGN